MDWNRYRALCDEGDVLSRWMLQRSAALLEQAGQTELAASVRAELRGPPLPKPEGHRGGPETDFFRLGLDVRQVERVTLCVERLVGELGASARDRRLAGYPVSWRECLDWLTGAHPRSPRRAADAGERDEVGT